MTTDKQKIDDYFTANYKGLVKYALRIITQRNKTFDAAEVVNEVYCQLATKGVKNFETIDNYCKRWVKMTIISDRSVANRVLALCSEGLHVDADRAYSILDVERDIDIVPERIDPIFEVIALMPDNRRKVVELFLKELTVEGVASVTGQTVKQVRRDLREAKTSFNKVSKQLIN